MLAKLALALVAAAVLAPAAAASGPMFSLQDGAGVVGGVTRYVPVGNPMAGDTVLEAISTKDGTVRNTLDLVGSWGLPYTGAGTEGLARDGRTLVLADTDAGQTSPSLFLVVDPKKLKIRAPITLEGWYSYDALSPDGTKLYLVEYTQGASSGDLSHYVVRAYDLRTNRLLPGRVADRTQKGWVMEGYPVTRTTSADGRWVYTLYQNPGGYPFVHALDTVRGVAHCVGLPMTSQNGIYNIVLALHGHTLAVHWRSGRRFLNVDTTTWRVSPAHGRFPWLWLVLGISLLACGSITFWWWARARWAAASPRWWPRRAGGSRSTTAPPAPSSAASVR